MSAMVALLKEICTQHPNTHTVLFELLMEGTIISQPFIIPNLFKIRYKLAEFRKKRLSHWYIFI